MCQSKSISVESNILFTRKGWKFCTHRGSGPPGQPRGILHWRPSEGHFHRNGRGRRRRTWKQSRQRLREWYPPQKLTHPPYQPPTWVDEDFRPKPFWGLIGFHRFPSRSLEGSQQWGEEVCPERLRSTSTTKCHGCSWMFRRSEMDDVRSYCWWCALSTGSRKTTEN